MLNDNLLVKLNFLKEGGRDKPLFMGEGDSYMCGFSYDNDCTRNTSAAYTFVDSTEIRPGDTVTARVRFLKPELNMLHMHEGKTFNVCEGLKVVATGVVVEKFKYFPLRMYVLVRDDIPLGLAVNSVGHSTLACYLKFKDDPLVKEWLDSPGFKKVTVVVNDKQFNSAKSVPDNVIMTEMALDGRETVIAFKPRRDYPDNFKFYQLFGNHLNKE